MKFAAVSPALLLLTLLAAPLCAAPSTLSQTQAPAQYALNHLVVSPNSPLPVGTRLRSVTVTDGLATADFNRALKDNFHGGDTEEAQAVNAILRTLGQFPTVNRVQILVDGRRVDSLGGLIVISDPLPVIRASATEHPRYLHRRQATHQSSGAHE